jgi:hypothetical protein
LGGWDAGVVDVEVVAVGVGVTVTVVVRGVAGASPPQALRTSAARASATAATRARSGLRRFVTGDKSATGQRSRTALREAVLRTPARSHTRWSLSLERC